MGLKGNPKGSLAERVAYAQQSKELEFQQTFMVTGSEAKEIKALAAQAKSGDSYDFSKLSKDASARLDALYTSINAKVGYTVPNIADVKPILDTCDAAANNYVGEINKQASVTMTQLRETRLRAFVSAFA